MPAGQGGDGSELTLVLVDRGYDDDAYVSAEQRTDAGYELLERELTTYPTMGGSACRTLDVYLVSQESSDQRIVTALASMCNDGHGASGVGEDHWGIRDNEVTYSVHGGSSWRWTEVTTLQLSPLQVLAKESEGFWTLGPNRERVAWDLTRFRGSVEWYAPRCGDPPAGPGEDDGGWSARIIPRIGAPAQDAGWQPGDLDWKLGTCAERLDHESTFVLEGQPEDFTAELRVASVGETLVVELQDDAFVSSALRSERDALEVWIAERAGDYGSHCLDALPPPQIARIDPTDGALLEGNELVDVVRHELSGGTLRFVVQPLVSAARITIGYRDADPGKPVAYVATSELDTARPESLGLVRDYPVATVDCVLESGSLNAHRIDQPMTLEPVIHW